jgi:hypothetical protein
VNYVGIVAQMVSSADALGLAEINCFNINLSCIIRAKHQWLHMAVAHLRSLRISEIAVTG